METPKVAIETVKAVSRVSTPNTHRPGPAIGPIPETADANGQGPVVGQQPASLGIDPALLTAEQIESQLLALNNLLNDELPVLLEQGGFEISARAQWLEALRKGLGEFQSKHTVNARAMLDEALAITTDILANNKLKNDDRSERPLGEWQQRIGGWGKAIKSLLCNATKLRSLAASQPGRGFGGSLDASALDVPPGESAYSKVLHQR